MLMKALANEVRAGFYFVKASNFISQKPGETARRISNTFEIARKNPPSIIFIDEIDTLAKSREAEGGETYKEALSQLLTELDGFQGKGGVVVVGATNMPHLLDPALMRPGRFDRIIYVSAAGLQRQEGDLPGLPERPSPW